MANILHAVFLFGPPVDATILDLAGSAWRVLTPGAWLGGEAARNSFQVMMDVLHGVRAYVASMLDNNSPPDQGFHGVGLSDLAALPLALACTLAVTELLLPLVGNFYPRFVSFLTARRYCELGMGDGLLRC